MKLIGAAILAGKLVSRSRQTRGRAWYDIRLKMRGIDLKGALAPDGACPDHWYSDSGYALGEFLRGFPAAATDAAIDLGCGKGGCVIALASRFGEADGLELSPAYAEIGQRNLKRLGLSNRCRIMQGDAMTFTDLDKYNVIYMFNAFPVEVLGAVMQHVGQSLRSRPRRLRIIYYNPKDAGVVTAANFRIIQEWDGSVLPMHVFENVQS